MSHLYDSRGLSDKPFIHDLQEGVLAPLLDRVQKDRSLDMEIRHEYVNIYYRGGNLLRVSRDNRHSGYLAHFNVNYGPTLKATLPGERIVRDPDTRAWLDKFPAMKNAMDLFLGRISKDERASQQMVVYENNVGSSAGGSDYFIVDIEYDNHQGARFDLVALRWDSDSTARKLQKNYLPRLTAIEMKTGDSAMSGKSGLLDHYDDWVAFFSQPGLLGEFKREMLLVFEQKRALGLIPALAKNHNSVRDVAADVDVVFLLANHDPASCRLKTAVDALQERIAKDRPGFNIHFATATFMGFGLYSQNILSLDAFRLHLERLAGK